MDNLKYCVEDKKWQLPSTDVQNSLKEEILRLQRQLEDQFSVRCELEKALSYSPILCDYTSENSVNEPVKDLIKEIAALELEVGHLEKCLLSLYRKTFAEGASPLSKMNGISKSISEVSGPDITSKKETSLINSGHSSPPQDSWENRAKECSGILGGQTFVDFSILRNHSSLSQRSASSFRTYPPMGTVAEAVNLCHSLPLSMLERAQNVPDVRMTPNEISEEIIKRISAIYCQLAEPPLFNHGFPSPISFSSFMSESSPQGQHEMRSPHCRGSSSFNSSFNNSLRIDGSKEFSGSFFTMAEVQSICRDTRKLRGVGHLLENFRSLVSRLEEVDPRKLRQEEKLAFWINVHNALVMQTFLVYGIPQRNLKRISLLLKAAYDIGGHTVSVDMIQSSILGCRLPRPGKWFQSLFYPKSRFKAGDARKAYAVEHPEPLLRFALCSGSHSDPAVRLYTPKRVFQELEIAKEEYIHTTINVHKEQKILLPKIVESFAKDLELCGVGLANMLQDSVPGVLRKSFKQIQQENLWKKIDWIPHNFTFRYLLAKELVE